MRNGTDMRYANCGLTISTLNPKWPSGIALTPKKFKINNGSNPSGEQLAENHHNEKTQGVHLKKSDSVSTMEINGRG